MPRQKTPPLFSHSSRIRTLLSVATVALAGLILQNVTPARNANAIELPGTQAPPSEVKEVKPLEVWHAEVRENLADAEARLQQSVADTDRKPAESLTKQVELLKRLDLTLSQLSSKLTNSKKGEDAHQEAQAALDTFRQAGIDATKHIPFEQLDNARELLASELERLNRRKQAFAAAKASLDSANQDLKDRDSARRKAKENADKQADDNDHGLLRSRLLEAKSQYDLAEAVVRLRKQEVVDAQLAFKTQQLRVKLNQEKLAQFESQATFDADDLNFQYAKIDRQADRLKHAIKELERAAPKVKYLEEKWIRAQRQLDEVPGSKTKDDETLAGDETSVYEESVASELAIRALQEELSLLREQLDRLATHREIWSRRQQIFAGGLERKQLRLWEDEASEALVHLDSKQRSQNLSLEKLRDLLKPVTTKLDEIPGESPQVYWLQQQAKSLEKLLAVHQQNLGSIRSLQKLQQKLRGELKSDSLAASAKDGLIDVWDSIGSAWNYELAHFDDQAITARKITTALLIVIAGFIFSRALSRWLGKQVLRRLDFDPSARATIQSLFYYVLLVLFSLFALKVVRVPLTAFTVLGGAVALGVGFGSQNLINNFISGLVLLAERPVKVGDLIQIEDLYGNIEHIGARSTLVRTGSNLEIVVPNRLLLQDKLINYTLSSDKVRTMVEVGVAYESEPVKVTQQLRRAAAETGRVAKDPPPIVLFKNFGDSALVFEVHFWIRMRTQMDRLQIESAVRYRIAQLFRDESITIAFPQQDVHFDTSEPLTIKMAETPSTPPETPTT